MVAGFLLSIALAVEGLLPAAVPIVWLFFNFGITQNLAQRRLRAIQSAVLSLHGDLRPLMRLVRHIQSVTFHSEVAKRNAETIGQATDSLERLTDIVGTMVFARAWAISVSFRQHPDAWHVPRYQVRGLATVGFQKDRSLGGLLSPNWMPSSQWVSCGRRVGRK